MTAAGRPVGDPTVDGPRLIERLHRLQGIGAVPSGGVTREAFGPLDVEARSLVAAWMSEAGLVPVVDAATNLVGRRTGTGHLTGSDRWLATGSHLDTVVDGGALDGAYGVVAAVEVAHAIEHSGMRLHHGLAAVAFANEEGARGTDGMVGSRALLGAVGDAELATPDDAGVTLAQRLAHAGGNPADLPGAIWDVDAVAAFIELHIEQGPVLDTGRFDVGAVTAITGRQGVDIDIVGAANHAGTTPMALRHDALVVAAEIVIAVESLARDGAVRVATCGHLECRPNVRNVVPGRVLVSAELRDEDAALLVSAQPVLERAVGAIAAARGVEVTVTWGQYVAPIAADPTVLDVVEQAAARTARPWRSLPSGAGHDAQILGGAVPMGMIFVPSIDGISHSPLERTDPEHLVLGAQLLLDSLVDLDRRLGPAAVGEAP